MTTPGSDPFGYGAQWGYYTDRESGLQLLTHRYYDPQAGRFVTRDPSGYAGGFNLYSHVQNNPLAYSDPSGLDGWGNNLANWLDSKIGAAEPYWHYDDQEWVANGVNASVAQVAHGFADMFRVGSGVGHAFYADDENGYGRAADAAMDVTRAAGLFQMLAGPFAGRVGNCFVAGTLVQTVEGVKRIEEVKTGDVILSADEAQPATALLAKDGVIIHVDSVDRRVGKFKVYNFEVAQSHTYFISALGLLVHNQCRTWPNTLDEMDNMLGVLGDRIPDGSNTPGRCKVAWKPSDKVKIPYGNILR